jgi:CHASE3 domain sensor protein
MAAPSPTSIARLVGLLIVGVLFLAGIGLFGVEFTHDEGHTALQESVESSALLDEARLAQVTFKVQVQDWKNFLLRGQNPADYDKYVTQFGKTETEVDGALGSLKSSALLSAPLREEVGAIQTEHARLGVVYREAMKKYDRTQAASAFAVDASVRGIDQALTQRIDAVAQQILSGEKTRVDALKEQFDRRYRMLRMMVIAGTLGVLALLAAVVWRTRAATR